MGGGGPPLFSTLHFQNKIESKGTTAHSTPHKETGNPDFSKPRPAKHHPREFSIFLLSCLKKKCLGFFFCSIRFFKSDFSLPGTQGPRPAKKKREDFVTYFYFRGCSDNFPGGRGAPLPFF